MAKKRPMQPDDLYLLNTVADPQISPDGSRTAYVVARPDRESDEVHTSIWIAHADGSARARPFTTGKKDSSPRFSPDGTRLAFVSDRGEEAQIFVAHLEGGEPAQVTKAPFGAGQPSWSPDGTRIAFAARTGDFKPMKQRSPAEKAAPRVVRNLYYRLDGVGLFDERRFHIFVVDPDGESKAKQITRGDWNDQQPSWSPDGKSIAFVADRERGRFDRLWYGDVWVVSVEGGTPRKLTRSLGGVSGPLFSPDGALIAYVGHEHGEAGTSRNTHLFVVPTHGGTPRSLTLALDRSPSGWPLAIGRTTAWLPGGDGVLFVAADRGAMGLYRVGLDDKPPAKVIGGDRHVEAFSLAEDGRRLAYATAWHNRPGEVYAATLDTRGSRLSSGERQVSHANDKLKKTVELGAIRRVTHRSPDGLDIESFVVYPPGYRAGKRYPVILDIHGGPHGLHPSSVALGVHQCYAGAGYVVLLPNPRGSASYGESFTQGCVRDWGGGDYDDLMGAVDRLVSKGIADPDRLYVGGYSYGGFMTSWVVGHTDRFRAAIIGAPVTDLVSMFGSSDIPKFSVYEIGGTPWERPEEYAKRSPLTYMSDVRTPVMLVHWEGDLRCPPGQSDEIFVTLKTLGREVELVRYPGGSHVGRTPSQAVDRTARSLDWFARQTPRRRPPPRPRKNNR